MTSLIHGLGKHLDRFLGDGAEAYLTGESGPLGSLSFPHPPSSLPVSRLSVSCLLGSQQLSSTIGFHCATLYLNVWYWMTMDTALQSCEFKQFPPP